MWRLLRTVLLLYIGHGEWFSCYLFEKLLPLFLGGKLALGGSEHRVAIIGGKHVICLWLKIFYLFLPVYDEGERWCLHTSYAQHLAVLSIFQCIKPGGVHSQYPVAY